MQREQDFYRTLVSDAAARALLRIRDILADDALSDETCFAKIEAIVSLLEELGVDCGSRHDFGCGRAAKARPRSVETTLRGHHLKTGGSHRRSAA